MKETISRNGDKLHEIQIGIDKATIIWNVVLYRYVQDY